MPSLREIQTAFAEGVLDGGPASLAGAVVERGLSGSRRLQLYRNNTFASLTEALAAVYPVVQRLVGDDFFRFVAARYIPEHPSRSGNLHDFGGQFAGFLAGLAETEGLPYLPDVARLEWAYHQVFHEADRAPLDPAALGRVPPEAYETLRFRLHPASRLVASPYPVLHIWQVNQEGFSGDPSVRLDEGAARILVFRRGLEVELQALAEGEFALLQAFARDHSLTAAAEAALQAQPEFDLSVSLRHHVVQGTLVDFSWGHFGDDGRRAFLNGGDS